MHEEESVQKSSSSHYSGLNLFLECSFRLSAEFSVVYDHGPCSGLVRRCGVYQPKDNNNPCEFSRYDNKHVNNVAVVVMSAVKSP